MKVKTATDTGIYRRVRLQPETKDEARELIQRGVRSYNFEAVLRDERQNAINLLAAHGVQWIDRLTREQADSMSAAGKEEYVNRMAAEHRKAKARPDTEDASNIIRQIDELLGYVAKHGLGAPLVFAFRLGRDVERMRVRWAEPHVASSKRQRKGSAKGGKRTAARPERLEARERTLTALKEALDEGLPITAAKRRVARDLQISLRTVYRHCA